MMQSFAMTDVFMIHELAGLGGAGDACPTTITHLSAEPAIPIQMQGRRMSPEIADHPHRVAIQIDLPPKNTDGWILLRSRKKMA